MRLTIYGLEDHTANAGTWIGSRCLLNSVFSGLDTCQPSFGIRNPDLDSRQWTEYGNPCRPSQRVNGQDSVKLSPSPVTTEFRVDATVPRYRYYTQHLKDYRHYNYHVITDTTMTMDIRYIPILWQTAGFAAVRGHMSCRKCLPLFITKKRRICRMTTDVTCRIAHCCCVLLSQFQIKFTADCRVTFLKQNLDLDILEFEVILKKKLYIQYNSNT